MSENADNSDKSDYYIYLVNKGINLDEIEADIERQIIYNQKQINRTIAEMILAMNEGYSSINRIVYRTDEIIPIESLVLDHPFVNIAGRVKFKTNPTEFSKKDGAKGWVGEFIIQDKTGQIRIILFDKYAELLLQPEFKTNELVYIKNAILKRGKNGLEIHMSQKSTIEVNPKSLSPEDYPNINDECCINISNLNLNMQRVTIRSKIKAISDPKVSKSGNLFRSIEIFDETGCIRVYWFKESEIPLDAVRENQEVILKNFTIKMFENSKKLNLVSDKYSEIGFIS